MSSHTAAFAPLPDAPAPPVAAELAAHLAGRLCHDLISPVSAIVSGLDLLEDPSAQDMREDAMGLITASARKLAEVLSFARVAYGASASADTFDPRELERLTRGVFSHVRGQLDWSVEASQMNKPAARALLNMALIGSAALPTGGVAKLQAQAQGEEFLIELDAAGPRARLRAEALAGLQGLPLSEGMAGQWVQPYYLHALVSDAEGRVEVETGEDRVSIRVYLPLKAKES